MFVPPPFGVPPPAVSRQRPVGCYCVTIDTAKASTGENKSNPNGLLLFFPFLLSVLRSKPYKR